MKRRLTGLLTAAVLCVSALAGCSATENAGGTAQTADQPATAASGGAATEVSGEQFVMSAQDIKVGAIVIGDENEGYTAAHLNGLEGMKAALGLTDEQLLVKTNIADTEACYDAATDLVDQGCNIIFANSFGHETYLMQAAEEHPEVQFCHATGYQAALSGLENFHNYFTAIYQSRYVSGVVAGMKINEMIANGEIMEEDAKIGYVGAFPFAEVISGFTSFYLGAKSVCPSVTMTVRYTNSWGDLSLEKEMAKQMVADGCVLLSQHSDTVGTPTGAQESGVPCVGYNISMISAAPDSALTSATMDWSVYYTYAVKSVLEGTPIATDWAQGYPEGVNLITELNEAIVAEGTAEKVAEIEAKLTAGTLNVFDTSTFTVGGKTLEELIAEGGDYAKYADYVSDGYFHESELASAPAFDLIIDGIDAQVD
ncbi:MAG: BMP family ABC transporter substrate-binding protein [Lachnospiraceae bacterium]|nr:BMP family ABC transporter substrate-binding protein [Lachnospiraceae bacterium]